MNDKTFQSRAMNDCSKKQVVIVNESLEEGKREFFRRLAEYNESYYTCPVTGRYCK